MMRQLRVLVVTLGVIVGTWGAVSAAAAQEPAGTGGERMPRFLLASADRGKPAVVDARSVPVLRRRISIALEDVSLAEALSAIASEGHIQLNYSRDIVPLQSRVRLKADDITVAAALTEVLLGAGVDVLIGANRQVALVRHVRAVAVVQGGTILGRVTDTKTGEQVAKAEVFLGGTRWRTTTDTSGRYRLADVDPGSYALMVRRFGYVKQSRKVTVRPEGDDTVDVALAPAAAKLEDLVTTATGQQRRRDIGNDITVIHADSVLRTAPIRSLTDLLANRVPGMSLQHTSGAPGDPARIRLRGLSSVMRGNDPVVVVDGVRVYSAQSEARSGNLTNLIRRNGDEAAVLGGNTPAPSPLDQIDPNIIEKIEVFKGPSAATLYGADAANGVIVITTKKGKPGPTRWTANVTQARTIPAGTYPTGYWRWGHEPATGGLEACPLFIQRCKADSLILYQALNDPDVTIFGRGQRTALSLSASGGSQALTYNVTGSYADETGLLKLPAFEVGRFRTRFNREAPEWMRRPHHLKTWSVTSTVSALLGPNADVSLTSSLARSDQQRTSLENLQPLMAGVYLDKVNGEYWTSSPDYSLTNRGGAPLEAYYGRTTASAITLTTALVGQWRPRSWFNALGRAGVNVIPRDDEYLLPTGMPSPSDGGALIRGTGRSLESTFELRGTLRRPLKWGFTFETNLGTNLAAQGTNDLVSSATGLVPGTSSLSGATSVRVTDARVSTSVFGWYIEPRITGQRISLSTGIRLDGGSAYGARLTRTGGGLIGGLLGLPKLNGSWVISEEPWFPFRSVVSSLRLRGAYGQAQVQPGATDRLRLYTRSTTGVGDLLQIDQLGNVDLRPERSTEFEGGFDADLVDSRLSIEFSAYRKVQVDALMPVRLPSSVHGGGTTIRNIGNIRNTGIDVAARVMPIQSALATWSAKLIYSRNNNVLTKLGAGVDPNPLQGIVAGYPVSGRWSKPILGFADQDGDGVIEAGEVQVGDSLVFMGREFPAYRMSLFTDLALLNGTISLTAGFSYDAGATQVDRTARQNWVLNRAFVDPTTPLDQQAAVAAYNLTDYGMTQDVSTLRFNSLAVTYHAPARISRLLHAQRLSVSLQGDNLAMHSTYRGKDPDVTAWSPTENIVDTGQIAVPRTWQLAFYLDF